MELFKFRLSCIGIILFHVLVLIHSPCEKESLVSSLLRLISETVKLLHVQFPDLAFRSSHSQPS